MRIYVDKRKLISYNISTQVTCVYMILQVAYYVKHIQKFFILLNRVVPILVYPILWRGEQMGRKDTIVAKTIQKMYEQLHLDREDIFYKTKMLLGVYRDVVWITLNRSEGLNEELFYYGDNLNSALVYLEQFAPDIERQEFENRVCSLFENKWMIDLIDTAMGKIYDYHHNGKLYHEILSKSYLTAFRYTESELLELLNMERSTFYDRKKEAIMLLGISLWGYTIPYFKGIFKIEGDDICGEIPDFFVSKNLSD